MMTSLPEQRKLDNTTVTKISWCDPLRFISPSHLDPQSCLPASEKHHLEDTAVIITAAREEKKGKHLLIKATHIESIFPAHLHSLARFSLKI